MSNRMEKHFELSGTRVSESGTRSRTSLSRLLKIEVIFTTWEASRRALRTAGNLACDLGASVRFIVFRTVPYAFPLHKPPVSAEFTERRYKAIAEEFGNIFEIDVLICNCRSPRLALEKVLRPGSLVVIGGEHQWWATKASRLAASLRAEGYDVILARCQEDAHVGSFLSVCWRGVFRRLLGIHKSL